MSDINLKMPSVDLLSPLRNDFGKLTAKASETEDHTIRQVAKDFESVLMMKIVQAMSETIHDSGLLNDSSSTQIKNMFWSFLAEHVGDQGGTGMWREIYEQIKQMTSSGQTPDESTVEQLL
jgi:Rod binding domain-containing protein